MQQRERKKFAPHLPSFNQNSVCWHLEKMSAYLPRRCVSSHQSPSFLLTFSWNLQFLSLLSRKKGGGGSSFYQLSFKSPTWKLIALWRRLLQGASRDNLIAQLLSKLKRRTISVEEKTPSIPCSVWKVKQSYHLCVLIVVLCIVVYFLPTNWFPEE